MEREQVRWQAVMDGGDPARLRQGPPLRIRDGHDRHIRELPVEWPQFLEIEAAVKRRHVRRMGQAAHERKVKLSEMEMNDVELARPGGDLFEHPDVRYHLVPAGAAGRLAEQPAAIAQTSRHGNKRDDAEVRIIGKGPRVSFDTNRKTKPEVL